MADAKTRISGIGHRYAIVARLGADGVPEATAPGSAPTLGVFVERVKEFSPSDPTPRREVHLGDDLPYAQDSLPPAEVGSFTVSTSQVNLDLEALLTNQRVAQLGASAKIAALGVNTNRRGSEPLFFYMSGRQALDTGKASPTAGALRQWEFIIYPSVRFSPSSHGFGAGATDKTYQATPTPANKAPWGEAFTEAVWGFTSAEALRLVSNYPLFPNWWLGNGTLTTFQLSHAPAGSGTDTLKVWVNGSLVVPSSVNLSSPSFALSTAPSSGSYIFALIETDKLGGT
ncbi:MAG: hypothetical protein KatS3mg038_1039 [Candidatus Kapaibacterium sp.]|nr:MAG: hypothetical protein KatS3mg038_1039 [Candidatus Kapabacteria bacterium]